MTLLDAQPYDTAKARRRKIQVIAVVAAVLVLAALAWMYRNWPEEHAVDKFFTALQHQDYETAYGIYFNDPGWRQHQQKYSQYTYADFYRDWVLHPLRPECGRADQRDGRACRHACFWSGGA